MRQLFEQYRDILRDKGASAWRKGAQTILSGSRQNSSYLVYTPFEHVNKEARLVLVGITPGPEQLDLAYEAVRRILLVQADRASSEVLAEVKQIAAFGGATMRPKLLEILKHFRFAQRLGIPREEDLWTCVGSVHLHATSIIPHAAFVRSSDKHVRFAGPFSRVLSIEAFRSSFQMDFLPSLTALNRRALFIALGPTPFEALMWCVKNGYLREDQVLGAFPHPSIASGSAVDVYLHRRGIADLNMRDPVRYRVQWLEARYVEMSRSIDRVGIT